MKIWAINGQKLTVLGDTIELVDGVWKYMPHGAPASRFDAHTTIPSTALLQTDAGLHLRRQRRNIVYIGLSPRMACRLFVDGVLTARDYIRHTPNEVWITPHLNLQNGGQKPTKIECLAVVRKVFGEDYLFFNQNNLRLI